MVNTNNGEHEDSMNDGEHVRSVNNREHVQHTVAEERTDPRGGTSENGCDLLLKTLDVEEDRVPRSSGLAPGLLPM